ncbi:hypothetical protein LINPERHAP2_LOCUS41805, partial [Linum perenne]
MAITIRAIAIALFPPPSNSQLKLSRPLQPLSIATLGVQIIR